jgi:hypothetical protein
MRTSAKFFSLFAICSSLLLVGCGGGSVDIGVTIEDPPRPAFDIILRVNALDVPGVDLLPGQMQTVHTQAGNSFELESSSPVSWRLIVDGATINAAVNGTVLSNGAAIMPKQITNFNYAATTSGRGFLSAPVNVTLVATSLADSRKQAQMNIVLTN